MLVAVLPVSATYYDINNTINQGAVVYIGEQQLNVTNAMGPIYTHGDTAIGWWSPAAVVGTTAPTVSIPLSSITNSSYYISSASFGAYTGPWYGVTSTSVGDTVTGAVFNVQDPSVSVDVWDETTATAVTGGTAIQGDNLTFRINTNLQSALDPTKRSQDVIPGAAQIGNIDIKVHSTTGNTYTSLFNTTLANGASNTASITSQNVSSALWFWGTVGGAVPVTSGAGFNINYVWNSAATDSSGQLAYPAGVYTVVAQSRLNGMYDNYLNGGATYTGKTVSQPATVTLSSNTVAISANVNSVVRSKAFSVTITGKPYGIYHLWIKGTSTMNGNYDNQPPYITANQANVVFDPINTTSIPAANNPYNPVADNGAYVTQYGVSIWNDVAHGNDIGSFQNPATASGVDATAIGNGTFEYANVSLDQTGTRTVQWSTTNWTKAQQYTIRVEQDFGTSANHNYKYDEVNVQVQKGAVTIVAAGSQSYYLGEEVQFSGTNTESQTTYLFIVGPNLATNGAQIGMNAPAQYPVTNNNPGTFQQVNVLGDNTWSWEWGTSNVALDAGTYTVYAVSEPNDANNLANVAYGTVSIILKAPFVSATASPSTIAQGDDLYITGTAEGNPSQGVQVWIFGKNFASVNRQSVASDGSFSYEIEGAVTSDLANGQYFVVVQHPMENGVFDVQAVPPPQNADTGQTSVVYTDNPISPGQFPSADSDGDMELHNCTTDFALFGPGALQGPNAAQALVQALSSANVDDTYTTLPFRVETPYITINPIGDHRVGDTFTITGETNLAVDDNVLFTIYSSSFVPTDTNKTEDDEFSGASGTVAVTPGSHRLNQVSFDVDASTFEPDEYLVTAKAVDDPTTNGTALFNILEANATAAPITSPVPSVPAGTDPVAALPGTMVPVTTAIPSPTQPGFGGVVAVGAIGICGMVGVDRKKRI